MVELGRGRIAVSSSMSSVFFWGLRDSGTEQAGPCCRCRCLRRSGMASLSDSQQPVAARPLYPSEI